MGKTLLFEIAHDPFNEAEDFQSTNFQDQTFFHAVIATMTREEFDEVKDQFIGLPVMGARNKVIGRIDSVAWNETNGCVVALMAFDKGSNPVLFKALDEGIISTLPDAFELPGRSPLPLNIVEIEPPEFMNMPIRQDVTVLGPDPEGKTPIGQPICEKMGIIVREKLGFPIYKLDAITRGHIKTGTLSMDGDWPIGENGEDLPTFGRNDLRTGEQVLVRCLGGWVVATIQRYDVVDGKPYADTEDNLYFLQFDEEDQHWVSTCQCNKRAIEKIVINGTV